VKFTVLGLGLQQAFSQKCWRLFIQMAHGGSIVDPIFVLPTNEMGIGLVLAQKGNVHPNVDHIVAGSPAAKCGVIKVGDWLEEVDSRPLTGLRIDEIKKLLHGDPGTSLTLKLGRPDPENEGKVMNVVVQFQRTWVHSKLPDARGFLFHQKFAGRGSFGFSTSRRKFAVLHGATLLLFRIKRGVVEKAPSSGLTLTEYELFRPDASLSFGLRLPGGKMRHVFLAANENDCGMWIKALQGIRLNAVVTSCMLDPSPNNICKVFKADSEERGIVADSSHLITWDCPMASRSARQLNVDVSSVFSSLHM